MPVNEGACAVEGMVDVRESAELALLLLLLCSILIGVLTPLLEAVQGDEEG